MTDSWCSPELKAGMAIRKLESHRKRGSPSPSPYREGSAARQVEQGESLATSANPLGECQTLGCAPSN
jgi:hypothetical protein